jgi:hypothetical protein
MDNIYNKYINSIVHVRYDKKEENEFDDTGVVLLGFVDDGFDTSAGIFPRIYVQDDPININNSTVLIDSRCIQLLNPDCYDRVCLFLDKITDEDPEYMEDALISYLVDIDIEGSIDGRKDIFIDPFGHRHVYALLL